MKLQLVSDLHLEFGSIEIPNNGADTLILSGDICVAQSFEQVAFTDMMDPNCQGVRFLQFFNQVCRDFKNVVYVFGNHEHYHGDFARTADIIKSTLSHHRNLHILDVGHVVLDDVCFVGGTLWTDFKRGDPVVKLDAQRVMNDYRTVKNNAPNKFLPDDAIAYHEAMLKYIDSVQADKVVVVGHHAPSYQSVEGRYAHDQLVGAYVSDLSDFILDRPRIKLWTHGHTHFSFDYMIGSARVVCNPRGYYGYEENFHFDPLKVIEV